MEIEKIPIKRKHKISLMLISAVFILSGILLLFFLGLYEDSEFWKERPVGTTMYFLLKEVGKILFLTGAVTIFLNVLFKKLSESETEERESERKEQITNLDKNVRDITKNLTEYVTSLSTMIDRGIVSIHKSRKGAYTSISQELRNNNNKVIKIMGISLRDILKGDNLFSEEWKQIKSRIISEIDPSVSCANQLRVQLLLLDPCCEQAIYRAESEEPRRTTHRERNLFIEITQLAKQLEDLLVEEAKSEKVCLEVKLYDLSVTSSLIISDNFAFVEQYYYRKEITSGRMPVVQYDINSEVGDEMNSHFNFVWGNSRNLESYIKEKNIGFSEAIRESNILNIFLDREQLTERLKYHIGNISGDVMVAGISLSSYTNQGSILMRKLGGKDQPIANVQMLLINPLLQQAKYRAAKESNHPYVDYTLDVHKDHRLYNDAMGSIREINRLTKLKYPIEGRVYSSAPSCFIFLNEKSVFVEQYHYGKTDDAKILKDTVLSRMVPVIEYSKNSTMYELMKDHLKYVWRECSTTLDEFSSNKESYEAKFGEL